MLVNFDEIIEVVLHHEGGYVNDPKDPGGETNFGIAKRSHPDVDIKNLTKEGAKEIYKEHYWDRNKVESLSEDLRHIYFDMCVNQGRGRAVKIAGDRTIPNWTITVLNDTSFKLRNAFERWQNGINNMTDNEGLTNPVDYQVDAFVDHLDRNGNTIKSYTLRGAYPVNIGEIALDYDEKTEIETFTVEFAYQLFESNTTT